MHLHVTANFKFFFLKFYVKTIFNLFWIISPRPKTSQIFIGMISPRPKTSQIFSGLISPGSNKSQIFFSMIYFPGESVEHPRGDPAL